MPHLQTPDRHPSAAAIAALGEDLPHDVLDDLGEGAYNRRLTDKILAAFNHAYATGEFEVASILRSALAKSTGQPDELDSERRTSGALGQADLWVRYVNARNAFRSATNPDSGTSPATVDVALDRMKDAYRRWSAN